MLTQNQLAAAVNINAVYLSQIETGKRTGSLKTLAAIASTIKQWMPSRLAEAETIGE